MDKNDGHKLNVIWISSILKANICPKSSLIPPSFRCLHTICCLNIGYWRTKKTSDPQNGSGILLIKVQKTSHLLMKQATNFYFILLTINPHHSFHQRVLWGSRTVESHEIGVCTITMRTLMRPQLMTSTWIGGFFQVSPAVLKQKAKGWYCRCFLNGQNFCTSFVVEMARPLLKHCQLSA